MFQLFFAALASMSSLQASERPNVLWLSVEDMSPWIACCGDTVPTPNPLRPVQRADPPRPEPER